MHGLAGNLDPSAEKPPSYAELGRLPGFLSMACVLTELEVPCTTLSRLCFVDEERGMTKPFWPMQSNQASIENSELNVRCPRLSRK